VFDLPATSERIVTDLLIRDGVVVFISAIPSDSPCAAGGSSIIHGINAYSGGRLHKNYYDINGDGQLDGNDAINIGSVAKPIWIAPSGIRKLGMYYTPAILSVKDSDTAIGYFSRSDGSIDPVPMLDEVIGMFSWREIEGN
jgi:type IV pilus assembly protein PilY1